MRTTIDGNEAAVIGRLPAQRGVLHLPDHAVLAHGRAGRRVVQQGPGEPVGHRADRGGDAERGRRGGRAARRPAERRAGHHVHRVAGPAADDPQHVQDRRGADPRGAARGRAVAGGAGPVDLRRSRRRDGGPADRVRAARLVMRAGGARPGAGRAGGLAGHPGAVRALLRRVPHLARAEHDRAAHRRRPARARPRGAGPRAPGPRAVPGPPLHPRHGAEPRRVLPGPGDGEPVLRAGPRRGRRRRWTRWPRAPAASTTWPTTSVTRTPSGSS